MTHEEAQAIADIVAHADGGCDSCVKRLVGRLSRRFPEFSWSVGEAEASDGSEWDDDDDRPSCLLVTATPIGDRTP